MKKIYIISSLAMAGFMTSCYDLDTEPMSSVITEDQREEIIKQDPDKINALSDGIYANYNAQEACFSEFFDFGYPSIMLQLDSRTADFISTNADDYGWFSACAEYLDNTANSSYNIVRWRMPYNTIYSSNQVLMTISADETDDTLKYYRAQALTNRAFCYWVLAQIYQFNYAGHKDAPCVPLITEENQQEAATEGAPRASVEAVYNQIISDLSNAINLMSGNSVAVRSDKRYVDITVAYALRARAYLCMEMFDEAVADARTVINSGRFRALTPQEAIGPGFITLSDPNWVWGIYYAYENVMGLYTLSGFLGSYTYGYAYAGMWKCINNNLFDKISKNDPRRLWWIEPETRASNAQYYTAASGNAVAYLEENGFPDWAVTKFAPYDNVLMQQTNQADVPLIRIEEMYLIEAEALYRGGKQTDGIQALESFVNNYRWLGSDPYTFASTGKEFMDEIFFQREVEFWGEGMTYYDIMRLNLPVDRRNSNWTYDDFNMQPYAYYIPAGDPVLLMQIPASEVDNNPKITSNNPPGSASL